MSKTSEADIAANMLRALELLDESQQSFMAGSGEHGVIVDRAIEQCGAETVSYLLGGMRIGEIPSPGTADWTQFVENQRDHVARLTEAEKPGAPATGPGSVAWAQAQHTADWLDLNQNPLEHP